MRKILTVLTLSLLATAAAIAADMTTVWDQIKNEKGFITSKVDPEKAAANGFETLQIALNSQPTSADINQIKRLASTIDESQKVTNVSQQGVDVSVYAAPMSTDFSLVKMMFVIDKNDNDFKSLIILYGTCQRDNIIKALHDMSIQDLIGG